MAGVRDRCVLYALSGKRWDAAVVCRIGRHDGDVFIQASCSGYVCKYYVNMLTQDYVVPIPCSTNYAKTSQMPVLCGENTCSKDGEKFGKM